ncbi:alpha/beta fold hydrolase [Hoeflea sp.]|uniref:alpha/beta fold hydrolase n=1 Tax=Hoeflea sp. TaxID=1940281 RepID=UPI003B01E96D
MCAEIKISLLGHLRVLVAGREAPLPASKKARALLAFLVATGRPHRRERLCELFWNLPDDPKASLRWALSKLRKVTDCPEDVHIVADRERVFFDPQGVQVDIREIREALDAERGPLPLCALEAMVQQLDDSLLEGLDNAGDEAFDAWLAAERTDAEATRVELLKRILAHPDTPALTARKWRTVLRSIDPAEAEAVEKKQTGQDHPGPVPGEPGIAPSRGIYEERGRPDALERLARARMDAVRTQKIGFCEVPDGTKIAYATIGSGPPILKAANWLTHLEFDWASPIWGQYFAEIAENRAFIRYDERGCGLSDWDVKNLSFEAFVEDLEAVADKLDIQRFPLLGISQGCAVSIEYAVRHPHRVSGLILISGYAAGWRKTESAEEQARREAVMKLTELGWGTDNPAYRHIFSQTFMPDAPPQDLDWFDEFQRRTTSPANAARFQEAFGHIDVRHRLADVNVPTIVFHSKGDQRIPLAQGRELAAGIKDAEFVPLESRNHILVDGEPALQVCTEKIRRFLEENGL